MSQNSTVASTLRARNAARLITQAEAAVVARPFDEVPHIDITALVQQTGDEAEAVVASQIRDACIHVGFFYISGHGIDTAFMSNTFDTAKRFFELPDANKQAVSILNSAHMRGYTGLLEENTDPDNLGDLHEAFDAGLDLADDDPDAHSGVYGWGLNQWPELAGFREQVVAYHTTMVKLSKALYRGFALSLDLDRDFFTSKMNKPVSEIRLLRYPSQPVVDERTPGIGAHSDYDMFTILATDEVPALQLLNSAGEWIDAPPIPDAFIVNVGDLLERWTNDLYRSTIHRAMNDPKRDRYSIPFFSNIDPLEVVDVLPSCVSEDRPARYEPVAAGAYVEACMRDAYGVSDS